VDLGLTAWVIEQSVIVSHMNPATQLPVT